jgi:hypothetical protein
MDYFEHIRDFYVWRSMQYASDSFSQAYRW